MCDPFAVSQGILSRMGSRCLEEVFSAQTIGRRPPHTVMAGHCLECGIPLSHSQMFPHGRMPRYMCYSCYIQAINVTKTNPHVCLDCGRPLPAHLVRKRMREPRELKHAFCQVECHDYHYVKAGTVLGHKFNFGTGKVYNSYPVQAECLALEELNPISPGIADNTFNHRNSLPSPDQTHTLIQKILDLAAQRRNRLNQPIPSPQPVNRAVQADYIDAEFYETETDTRSQKQRMPKFLPLGRKR